MPSADQVLAVARSQIGTVENARGEQQYGAFYGLNGPAWCAMFQWWVFNQVPGGATLIPKAAYTPTFYQWFVGRGQASRTPVKGALVFYDWPDAIPRIQHVGIVEAVNPDGSITTIEGNTTSGQAGDQSNGGGVWRRRRSTSAVVGYGLPAYATAPRGLFMALTADEERVVLEAARSVLFGIAGKRTAGPLALAIDGIRTDVDTLRTEIAGLIERPPPELAVNTDELARKIADAVFAVGRPPAEPDAAPLLDNSVLAAAVADELQARLSRKE